MKKECRNGWVCSHVKEVRMGVFAKGRVLMGVFAWRHHITPPHDLDCLRISWAPCDFFLPYRALLPDNLTFPLWSITAKNTDCSTGPLARSFACSLARSLHSLPRSWESEFLMSQNDLVLFHSAWLEEEKEEEEETEESKAETSRGRANRSILFSAVGHDGQSKRRLVVWLLARQPG